MPFKVNRPNNGEATQANKIKYKTSKKNIHFHNMSRKL